MEAMLTTETSSVWREAVRQKMIQGSQTRRMVCGRAEAAKRIEQTAMSMLEHVQRGLESNWTVPARFRETRNMRRIPSGASLAVRRRARYCARHRTGAHNF